MNKLDKTKKESNFKADTVLKANHIMDEFKNFSDGIRVMILMHRPKEGGKDGGYKATIKRTVTRDSNEFKIALLEFLDFKERNTDIPYRIYSAVNSRDIEKAIRQLKFEQLEADYYDTESRHGFYFDIKNRFIGALMTPSSRMKDESYFIFDVDNEEGRDVNGECLAKLAELNVEIAMQYKTKNGWHIITKPFNPNLFNVSGVEIKKDGLLLLAY